MKRTIMSFVLILLVCIAMSGNEKRESAFDGLRCELQLGRGEMLDTHNQNHFHFLLLSEREGLRVFKESNMWGYFAKSFTLIDSAGKSYEVVRRERVWDSNWPAPVSIDKGDVLVSDVYLCDGSWRVSPNLLSNKGQWVKVVGRYALNPVTETDPPKLSRSVAIDDLWHGSIKSAPIEIILSKGCVSRLNAGKNL